MEKRINVEVIEACYKCKYFLVSYREGMMKCLVNNRRIATQGIIPRWCELPKP